MLCMTESLREQQKRLAQTRIIEAAAEEIVASGLASLSMAAVAERSGVSLRTVYNHFETKETLVDAIVVEAGHRLVDMAEDSDPLDFDRLSEAIPLNWRFFGELGTVGGANAIIGAHRSIASGQASIRAGNPELSDAIHNGVLKLCPGLDPPQVEAVASTIRTMVSFDAFHRLTHEFGLDPAVSAEVTAWAFTVLRDALAEGRGPFAD